MHLDYGDCGLYGDYDNEFDLRMARRVAELFGTEVQIRILDGLIALYHKSIAKDIQLSLLDQTEQHGAVELTTKGGNRVAQ